MKQLAVTHKAAPADSDVTEDMDTLFAAEVSTTKIFNDFDFFFINMVFFKTNLTTYTFHCINIYI